MTKKTAGKVEKVAEKSPLELAQDAFDTAKQTVFDLQDALRDKAGDEMLEKELAAAQKALKTAAKKVAKLTPSEVNFETLIQAPVEKEASEKTTKTSKSEPPVIVATPIEKPKKPSVANHITLMSDGRCYFTRRDGANLDTPEAVEQNTVVGHIKKGETAFSITSDKQFTREELVKLIPDVAKAHDAAIETARKAKGGAPDPVTARLASINIPKAGVAQAVAAPRANQEKPAAKAKPAVTSPELEEAQREVTRLEAARDANNTKETREAAAAAILARNKIREALEAKQAPKKAAPRSSARASSSRVQPVVITVAPEGRTQIKLKHNPGVTINNAKFIAGLASGLYAVNITMDLAQNPKLNLAVAEALHSAAIDQKNKNVTAGQFIAQKLEVNIAAQQAAARDGDRTLASTIAMGAAEIEAAPAAAASAAVVKPAPTVVTAPAATGGGGSPDFTDMERQAIIAALQTQKADLKEALEATTSALAKIEAAQTAVPDGTKRRTGAKTSKPVIEKDPMATAIANALTR